MAEETKQEAPKPKTLTQKLCEVMDAVGYLQKTGQNVKQGYKYAREADVVAALRPELAKRHIFIFPNVISVQRNKVERLDFDKALKFSWATDILVEWTIEDGESGETRKCIIPGCSESPGDKGVYVAMTGSEKYLLMKSFLLPTGDDPESDENEEKGSKEAAQAVGKAKVANKGKIVAPSAAEREEKAISEGASLFYVWHQESQTAEIMGDEGYKSANRDLLKPLWSPVAKAIVATGDQLEDLKYQLEVRKVPFRPLKAANA